VSRICSPSESYNVQLRDLPLSRQTFEDSTLEWQLHLSFLRAINQYIPVVARTTANKTTGLVITSKQSLRRLRVAQCNYFTTAPIMKNEPNWAWLYGLVIVDDAAAKTINGMFVELCGQEITDLVVYLRISIRLARNYLLLPFLLFNLTCQQLAETIRSQNRKLWEYNK
jgi:hypothetical protein